MCHNASGTSKTGDDTSLSAPARSPHTANNRGGWKPIPSSLPTKPESPVENHMGHPRNASHHSNRGRESTPPPYPPPVRPAQTQTSIPPPLLVTCPADSSKRLAYQKPGVIHSCPLPPAQISQHHQVRVTKQRHTLAPAKRLGSQKTGTILPCPPPPSGPRSGHAEP